MHVVGALGLGGATPAAVTAPSPTTESVAAGGAPAGKTFSAFTDPDGRIASYSASIVNAVGSTAIAGGSGLGAYTVSGYADGDAYSIVLTALDSSGDPLASAVHVVDIATAATNVTAPAATSESVASGGTPANVTFSAFTDPDGRIASYSKAEINAVGSATWTGTGLGAYSVSGSADGDSGAILLTALDSGGDPLATAVHVWDIAVDTGAVPPPELVWSQDFTTTACDAATWTNASTTGSITADSGATPIATWVRTSASGNSTNTWSWEVGANGFGLIGLQWSGASTSVGIGARLDLATQPAVDWDRDGIVIQMLVKRVYTAATPTAPNSEILNVGIGPDGSGFQVAHVHQVRHYQDSGGKDFLRGVASTFSATDSVVSWSSSSVIVLRLDRANVTMQMVEGATAMLSAAALDSTTYDYETVGATAITAAILATGNPWADGISPHFYMNSKNPVAGGGVEMSLWISEMAVYTSGVAQ